MSEPTFLTQAQVETLHRLALEQYGGQDGVRDPYGLDAAVIHPRNVHDASAFDGFLAAASQRWNAHPTKRAAGLKTAPMPASAILFLTPPA